MIFLWALLVIPVGFLLNFLAPVIAGVIMVILAYYLAIQAFYILCGLWLLPAQFAVMYWGHCHWWFGNAGGVFDVTYNSGLAWISCTIFWIGGAFLIAWLAEDGPQKLAERRAKASRNDYHQPARAARQEPVLALPAPARPTGREAVAAMVRNGNAATLAKLRGEAYSEPAPVVYADPEYVPGDISRFLTEDETAPAQAAKPVSQPRVEIFAPNRGGSRKTRAKAEATPAAAPVVRRYLADHEYEDEQSVDEIVGRVRHIKGEPDPEGLYALALRGDVVREQRQRDRAAAQAAHQVQYLSQQVEHLSYQLSQQQRQQPSPEPEWPSPPEPNVLASIHGGLTSMVRNVGTGVAVAGAGVLAIGIAEGVREKKEANERRRIRERDRGY